ncbi:MAG: RNA-directed DNA polymerase [Bacteroidales bacterium]
MNLCYLALAIEAVRKCEGKRMMPNVVFSYRFDFSRVPLFLNIGYSDYIETINSYKLDDNYSTIVTLDLKDFYNSISPQLLSESLTMMGLNVGLITKISNIIEIVEAVGLPIGGDASRILSECVIDRLDWFLCQKGITFARFVDDITLFLTKNQDAETILNELRHFLQSLELSLNEDKVKVERDGFWQTQKYPVWSYCGEFSLIRELNRTYCRFTGHAIKFANKNPLRIISRGS